MASILSKLELLEIKVLPGDCVAILSLEPDGNWILIQGERRSKYKSETAGKAAFRGKHLIIDDI